MKKIVKTGILLVLFAFLHNLITVFAEYWEEPGGANRVAPIYTTFGDWEYFYHETFNERTETPFIDYKINNDEGVKFTIGGKFIDANNENSINDKGVLLNGSESLIIKFPRGLGGFSFDYKMIAEGSNINIKAYDDDYIIKEPRFFESVSSTENLNEVKNQRYDINLDIGSEEVYLIIEATENSKVVIDNIKWSDHNILVTLKHGYNDNKVIATEYFRYGRTGEEFLTDVEENKLEGYEDFLWYEDPALTIEFNHATPIKENTTLYLDRELTVYIIEYNLNDGFFEPFKTRDEMITGFLSDLYEYLDENGQLMNNDFHNVLIQQGHLNEGQEITKNDFIHGKGKTSGFDGLSTKGFVIDDFKDQDAYPISYNLDDGYFAETGGSNYPNNNTGRTELRNDFLKDFHTYLKENHGYTKSLNVFSHGGTNKTTGFDGEYDIYIKKLFSPNTKTVDSSLKYFINQPEYNKWVHLLNLMDDYTKAVNPSQSFWGSTWTAGVRIKEFMKKERANQTTTPILNNVLAGKIKKGGTPQNVPFEYDGTKKVTLPTPTKGSETFSGWYEYGYDAKGNGTGFSKITEISKGREGLINLYAKWGTKNPTPIPYDDIPKMLHQDSYFGKMYKMDDDWVTEGFNLDYQKSNLQLLKENKAPLDYFINQPEYNKWVPLIDLIHEYTAYGNPAQAWHGIWKSYYTGIIRMEMFFQQDNPWIESQRSELQYTVFEMLRRVPHTIAKERITYTYTIESEAIDLLNPMKDHAEFLGWYLNPEFSNTAITEIPKGSTGNITLYAYYNESKYDITYDLDGGSFVPYDNRDQMIDDFLDDFYDFIKSVLNNEFTITKKQFKHGASSSGFNGEYTKYIYFSDNVEPVPVQLLYATGIFDVDNKPLIEPQTKKFINQEDYHNRWLPLLLMAADFTKDADAGDDFWDNPKLASERLKQLFRKIYPKGNDSKLTKYFSMIPNISKKTIPYYHLNDTITTLPTPVKEGYYFKGWKEEQTGQTWTTIPEDIKRETTFTALWQKDGTYDVTYDFGEYGYYGITQNELFIIFINNYIEDFTYPPIYTEEKFHNDFFLNSELKYTNESIEHIFTYNNNYWNWLEEYIKAVGITQNYNDQEKLSLYDEVIWRLNLDAFFNKTVKSITIGEEVITSIDFSSLEAGNAYWKNTPYNKKEMNLIPSGDLLDEEFINCWHPSYYFGGWLNDGAIITRLPAEPNKNLTLVANWIKKDGVVVTFVDYDDSLIEEKTFEVGETIIAPEDPIREHYTFTGWDKDLTIIEESTIVKALYKPHTYTLKFDSLGGTTIDDQELVYPELPTKPDDPEKEGYTFLSWYSDNKLNNEFYFEFPLYGKEDNDTITIYAKWDAIEYTITYYLDGGENHDANKETYTNLDVILLLPATKENHHFVGWYLDNEFNEQIESIQNRTGDLNLYAKFEIYKYTVSFDSDGGSAVSSQEVDYGSTATKPEDPEKDGFIFVEWRTNGQEFNFETLIYKDITLSAYYKKATYSVDFYNGFNEVFNKQTINHGEYAVIPDVPDKLDNDGVVIPGYNKKWNEDLTNKPIIKNYDVIPLYTPIEYKITYHLDQGTNHLNNPKTYNREKTINLSDATKEGYDFKGWYLTDEFLENEKIELIKNMYGDLDLYAKWSAIEYDITYHLDGGTNHTANPNTYTIIDTIELENPFKEGYEFKGWYLDNEFDEKIEIIYNQIGNLDLYAKYSEPVEYNIYYVLYEEEFEPNDPVEDFPSYTTYFTTLEKTLKIPSDRESSIFIGWYDNPEFNGDPLTKIEKGETGHKTVYAKWELRKWQIEFYNSYLEMLDENTLPTTTLVNIPHSSTINLPLYEGEVDSGYEFTGWHYLDDDNSEILFEFDQQVNRNFKVFPKFNLKKYIVTFYKGLEKHDEKEVYHGGTISLLPPVSDLNFEGWYLEDMTTLVDEAYIVERDLIVIAKLSDAAYHTVIFEYFDGDDIRKEKIYSIDDGKYLTEVPTPNRTGYKFANWLNNSSSFTSDDLLSKKITQNYTFVASYEINKYTVIFKNYDGTELANYEVSHGSNAVYKGNIPIKANSIFTGWNPEELTNIKEDTTFTAQFELNKYYVRFYNYDDSFLGEFLISHGETVTNPPSVPERDHYDFDKWDESLENITKHTDIYALFKGKEYTLTFDPCGGSSINQQNLVYPARTTKPANPTRDGYTFLGWYTLESGGSSYEFNQILTKDTTIYARWITEEVTVSFMVDGVLYDEKKVSYNTTVTKPNDPEKTGHEFVGWYLGSGKFEFTTPIKKSITLTAKFELKKLTVTFKDNDGTNLHTYVVDYGNTITVPTPPTKEGYNISWDTNLTNRIIDENMTVTAVYTPIVYSITYNGLFNGVSANNPTTYKITETPITLKPPFNIPTGNIFDGWYNNASYTGSKITEIPAGSTGNKVFYAKFKVTTYTITYSLDGGAFAGYANREEMILDFLTDFYNFLVSQGKITMKKTDFIHGTNKTSGFDGFYGLYDNDKTTYFDYLYDANDKRIDASTGKFINQPEYNKWVPLLDLMDEYAKINPEQDFWGSVWIGVRRIKPFVLKENMWKSTDQEKVERITNTIPEGLISEKVYYEYNLNSPTITLVTPVKANYTFLGWYLNKDFTGSKVTSIPKGSTGNKKFYAKWSIPTYTITYNLEGGTFTSYISKEDLIVGFLQDLYDYLGATETLNTFMHGSGKTSGFKGVWYSKTAYKNKIYNGVKPTSNNESFFISASKYRTKWAPFFSMMEKFVKINPDQSFWGSTWTGLIRLDQYIRNVSPGPAWTNADLGMMPNPAVNINPQTTYSPNVRDIILPKPVREDHAFEGWYTNKNHTGSAVTTISKSSTGNKVFYAKWKQLVGSSDFTKKLLTQSLAYYNNKNKVTGHPRTKTLGVIILSTASPGVNADGWFSRWNNMTAQVTTHAVVDNNKSIQFLEWNYVGYHTSGDGNEKYVSIMIAENSGYSYNGNTITGYVVKTQKPYFDAVWQRAVALTVYLLKYYKITTVNQTSVVGRHEAYDLGLTTYPIGCPQLLFDKHNKTMTDFRADVRARM